MWCHIRALSSSDGEESTENVSSEMTRIGLTVAESSVFITFIDKMSEEMYFQGLQLNMQ